MVDDPSTEVCVRPIHRTSAFSASTAARSDSPDGTCENAHRNNGTLLPGVIARNGDSLRLLHEKHSRSQ